MSLAVWRRQPSQLSSQAETRGTVVVGALRWLGLASTGSPSPADRAFRRLAAAHIASAVGDAMVTVALAGSVFFSTNVNGARGRVALSLLITLAPFAVIAPFLGPAIDRSRGGRRWMVIISAAGRSVTCLYMATVVDDLLLFLPAALVLLILSKGYAVAKSSLVPGCVASTGGLVRAGSRLAVLAALSGLTAGLVGAGLLQIVGDPWTLRVAAVVYAAGTVMGVRLETVPNPPRPGRAEAEEVRTLRLLRAATAMTVLRATVGFLTFAVAFDFRRAHASSWWYGVVAGAGLVGGFVGNLVSPALRRMAAEERLLLASLAATSIAGGAAWWMDNRLGLVLLALTLGTTSGVARVSFDAIVQRDAEDRQRSRSFARFEATFQLAWVAAALGATAIAGRGIPGRFTPLAVSVTAAAAGVYDLVTRHLDRRRGLPAPPTMTETIRAPHGSDGPGSGPRRNPLRRRATPGKPSSPGPTLG